MFYAILMTFCYIAKQCQTYMAASLPVDLFVGFRYCVPRPRIWWKSLKADRHCCAEKMAWGLGLLHLAPELELLDVPQAGEFSATKPVGFTSLFPQNTSVSWKLFVSATYHQRFVDWANAQHQKAVQKCRLGVEEANKFVMCVVYPVYHNDGASKSKCIKMVGLVFDDFCTHLTSKITVLLDIEQSTWRALVYVMRSISSHACYGDIVLLFSETFTCFTVQPQFLKANWAFQCWANGFVIASQRITGLLSGS